MPGAFLDCGLPAEVVGRTLLPSTDGHIEHVKTRCITGHWYMTPIDYDGPYRAR